MAERDLLDGNYAEIIQKLDSRVSTLERREIAGGEAADSFAGLGLYEAFELRVHADRDNPRDPGDGFSGVRILDRYEYPEGSGQYWAILGVNNDSPTFLISAIDGTGKFANLHATLGANGIDIDEFLNYSIRHTFTNDGKTRIGKLGPEILEGSTTPVITVSYYEPAGTELMVNGGFEDGDLTGWTATTETNGAWEIDGVTIKLGLYSVKWNPTPDGDGNTKSLIHFDGSDAATTITDVNGRAWTARNHAQLDTAQKVFGTASLLLDGTDDYIDTPDHADFDLGTGDWEFEIRVRPHAVKAQSVFAQGDSSGTPANTSVKLELNSSGSISGGFESGSTYYSVSSAIDFYAADNWYVLSLSRFSNVLYLRIDGVTIDTRNVSGLSVNNSPNKFTIGRLGEYNSAYFNGWLDEFRYSKGVARHTEDYTPEIAAYGDIKTEGILTSDRLEVTGLTSYLISAYLRGTVLAGTIKAEVKFYDHASAGSLISTSLLGNLLASGDYEKHEDIITAPATALSLAVVLTCSSSLTSIINFDGISISVNTVNQKFWIADDGIHATNEIYPDKTSFFWDEMESSVDMSPGVNTSQLYNMIVDPVGDGLEFKRKVLLRKGYYDLHTLGRVNTDCGKIDLYINDVLERSGQDWYGASTYNVDKHSHFIPIPKSGENELMFKINGKHASSSNYYARLTKTAMFKTSDESPVYDIEYLIVAGGGGGGSRLVGGGGGAGGVLAGTISDSPFELLYTVTIGGGGAGGGNVTSEQGTNGGNSVLVYDVTTLTAIGGGGGGSSTDATQMGKDGGSGGGGGGDDPPTITAHGAGTVGQGYDGGHGYPAGSPYTSRAGGGGGGAGGVGGNATSSAGGAKGAPLSSSITGAAVNYAEGGLGGRGSTGTGAAGAANTGNGGDGGGYSGAATKAGGAGGSGVVILRIPTAAYSGDYTGTPTITTDGEYTIMKFTGAGTYIS